MALRWQVGSLGSDTLGLRTSPIICCFFYIRRLYCYKDRPCQWRLVQLGSSPLMLPIVHLRLVKAVNFLFSLKDSIEGKLLNRDSYNVEDYSSRCMTRSMSDEASTSSNDMMSRIKSKREQNDQHVVDVTEDLRIKLASEVGTSNLKKNDDAYLSDETQVGTRSDLEAKHFNAECSDPLDPLSTTSVDVGFLVNMKACRNKKKDAAREVTNRVDVPDKRNAFKQGIVFGETRMTRSKSKRKPKSGSSSCESTKSKRQRIGKGTKDIYGSANMLSPESFSGKKSRSGRVLLPALEFWRNQTVVYNADRQVIGVREGTYASRGISKDKKEFNKKARKTMNVGS